MIRSSPSSPTIRRRARSSRCSSVTRDRTLVWTKSSGVMGEVYPEERKRRRISSAPNGQEPGAPHLPAGAPEILRFAQDRLRISKLGRDQTEIAVLPLVDHRDLVGIEIAEDDELVLRVVEQKRGVLDGHWADRQIAGLDDAAAVLIGIVPEAARLEDLDRPFADGLAGSPRAPAVAVIADLLAVLLRLPLDVVDGGVDGVLHGLFGLLDSLHVVVLADDDDLADVPVLLDVEDDAHIDDVIEEPLLDLREFRRDQVSDFRADVVIPAGDLCRHSGTSFKEH